jgi:hypothetical protein
LLAASLTSLKKKKKKKKKVACEFQVDIFADQCIYAFFSASSFGGANRLMNCHSDYGADHTSPNNSIKITRYQ